MDGYAARAADLAAAATLKLAGTSAAGHPFPGSLKPGEAVRIFTGALLPAGADTVVPQEDAKADGKRVALPASRPGQYVRRKGLDFADGQLLLDAGRRISARDVALIAAMDYARVPVARRPRVAILATGDELIAPGSGAGPERTVASNPLSLAALLRSEGAETVDLGVVPDQLDATASTIRKARAAGHDVLVTLGGASVGEHDLVARALRAEGVAVLFLLPLLRKLEGRRDFLPVTEPAILGRALPANDHRQDYLRARIERGDDGRLVATALDRQDSSMVAYLAGADGLLIRRPHAQPAKEGDACQVIRFND
jgi:molybdopterin molybdotransferase